MTSRDVPSTTSNGKLIFERAPLDVRSGPVDSKQDQSRLPDRLAGLRIGSLLPDVGIPILRGGNNAVRVGGPINRCDEFVVLIKTGSIICVCKIGVATTYLRKSLGHLPLRSLT